MPFKHFSSSLDDPPWKRETKFRLNEKQIKIRTVQLSVFFPISMIDSVTVPITVMKSIDRRIVLRKKARLVLIYKHY